ncbi:MAG: asparagine synthase (glutamine-hydrolyzing) [Actinobacteria bacterium RBG_13_35_12]|nr:MAG: asparagine synthase (glutamine-hydrolyzing) [Actinobacteria bacterium RBG_13_35_12]
MCGIAGIFNPNKELPKNSREILRRMGEVLRHRGPDDYGEYISEHCGFSFCRLSIIDLEHGHQPMFSPSSNSVIVFNGEIYNYKELRKELEELGAVFKTNSDTEVILVGYEVWGVDIVSRLRGMFAFVIYDIGKNELFIARDHTGIKPFYFTNNSSNFVFASEAKSILKFPGITASVKTSVLPKYMSFLWVPAPDTLFENIYVLEPGHVMQVGENGIKNQRYWNPDLVTKDSSKTEKTWIELIDYELTRAVKEQMISDVPLGAFLSGGVDSSTIISFMNQVSNYPVTTYTTGFAKEDLSQDVILSDVEYARIASKNLKVDYNELILSPDVVSLLPRLIWHMDEPVADPAAITTYLICKAAKEKCTVMLSGVGGDEIFGGYPRYLGNIIAHKYQRVPGFIRKELIESWVKRIPTHSSSFVRNFKKFLKSSDLPFQERYFGYLTYYSQSELKQLLKMEFKWDDIFEKHRKVFKEYNGDDNIQSMMNLDLKTFLPNLNLMYTDKMSSAVSVEVRVPFLDHLLIEKAAKIPGPFKIKNGKRKYILKKTVEKRLPHEIIWRKKAGFGAPIGAWLKGQAKDMMLDLLSEENIKKRGYFNYPYVSNIIENHLNGKEYNANQLWQLITLELWHREFIDR